MRAFGKFVNSFSTPVGTHLRVVPSKHCHDHAKGFGYAIECQTVNTGIRSACNSSKSWLVSCQSLASVSCQF